MEYNLVAQSIQSSSRLNNLIGFCKQPNITIFNSIRFFTIPYGHEIIWQMISNIVNDISTFNAIIVLPVENTLVVIDMIKQGGRSTGNTCEHKYGV